MLLRLTVKNFLSFYEEVSFDMFPNLKRTSFPNHIYNNMEIPLLKMASIYGANGSGKSNLLRALIFLKEFATKKTLLGSITISEEKFRLAGEKNDEPISFSIEFQHQGTYLIYNAEINDDKVSESLYKSGLEKESNQLIFKRYKTEYSAAKPISKEVQKATNELIEKNPFTSLLMLNSEFPIIEAKEVMIAYDWFNNYCDILPFIKEPKALLRLYDTMPNILEFSNKVISKLGLGIEHIEVKKEKFSTFTRNKQANIKEMDKFASGLKENEEIQAIRNNVPYFSIEKEGAETIVKRLLFDHIGKNGFHGKLDFYTQSNGTVSLLNLIPALYNIVHQKCVCFIDELEAGIHPSVVRALIKFIGKEKTKGQLIFTTHLTSLLDQQELMRPDEIWFTEKNEGSTQLYSLNDFKEHSTINVENGYLQGRYGAIPFIGKLD